MKKAVTVGLITLLIALFYGCGGSGGPGSFNYGKKYTGNASGAGHYSDFGILLDGEGNIDSSKSYSGQGPRCSIAGSVRKTGNFLNITVVLTVPISNVSCSNIVMNGSGQLAYDAETKWWRGEGTGTFSDAPNTTVPISFMLAQGEW